VLLSNHNNEDNNKTIGSQNGSHFTNIIQRLPSLDFETFAPQAFSVLLDRWFAILFSFQNNAFIPNFLGVFAHTANPLGCR